tara:strand:- start:143 stop:307 length:165 start_codon:yes stop_codon:yes gene_type:complete
LKLTTDETMFITNMMENCQIYGKDAKVFVILMDKIAKERERLLKLDNPSLKKIN